MNIPEHKAFVLLWSTLNDGQKRTLLSDGYIEVVSNRDVRWRIYFNGWMYHYRKSKWFGWCCQYDLSIYTNLYMVPNWMDNMLIKKLILECSQDYLMLRAKRATGFDGLFREIKIDWIVNNMDKALFILSCRR